MWNTTHQLNSDHHQHLAQKHESNHEPTHASAEAQCKHPVSHMSPYTLRKIKPIQSNQKQKFSHHVPFSVHSARRHARRKRGLRGMRSLFRWATALEPWAWSQMHVAEIRPASSETRIGRTTQGKSLRSGEKTRHCEMRLQILVSSHHPSPSPCRHPSRHRPTSF